MHRKAPLFGVLESRPPSSRSPPQFDPKGDRGAAMPDATGPPNTATAASLDASCRACCDLYDASFSSLSSDAVPRGVRISLSIAPASSAPERSMGCSGPPKKGFMYLDGGRRAAGGGHGAAVG